MDYVKAHEGTNVRLFRIVRQLNQKQLAEIMGENWSQQKVAYWEKQPKIKESVLNEFAKAIGISIHCLQRPHHDLAQELRRPVKQAMPKLNYENQFLRKINELYHRLLISEIELFILRQNGSKN